MSGWVELALAMAALVAAHAVPARPSFRGRLIDRFGRTAYLATYIVLSLLLVWWVIAAAGRARYVGLWEPAAWQIWLALAAMALACLVLALAVGRPNPFSFGGGDPTGYDPARPGIVGLTRHPVLLAAVLWATAHLLANGDLAHVLVFANFLLMALGGMPMLDRRTRRRKGGAWARLQPERSWSWSPGDTLRLATGVLLFLALLHLHPALFGVDPLALL